MLCGVEVSRLTDQLRQEHDAASAADASRKKLEVSLRELSVRLEEVESIGDGKKNVMRMQQRVGRSLGLTELDIIRSRQHPSVSHTPCGALTILI